MAKDENLGKKILAVIGILLKITFNLICRRIDDQNSVQEKWSRFSKWNISFLLMFHNHSFMYNHVERQILVLCEIINNL